MRSGQLLGFFGRTLYKYIGESCIKLAGEFGIKDSFECRIRKKERKGEQSVLATLRFIMQDVAPERCYLQDL